MEAAFFDLDKTVIAKASMVAFGRPFYRAGLISRWLLLRALYGQLVYLYLGADEARMAQMRDTVLRLIKGWDQAKLSAVVQETLEEVIDPIVFDEALDLIRTHQAAGRRVYIISASPAEIVVPLARYLGVDEAVATRARLDADGRYTGEVAFSCFGINKAEAMRAAAVARGLDLSRSFAYSDSMSDLPMLDAVGHPVVVNPDRDLARVAKARGWEVRWFQRRVPLRSRRHMPAPGPAAAVGGGLATTAGAAAVVLWWLRRDSPGPAAGVRRRGPSWRPTRPARRGPRAARASS